MTTAKILAMTAGVAGAIALGVWAVPRMTTDEAATTPAMTEAAEPAATAPARSAARPAARPAPPRVVLAADSPQLHDALKPVLNRGTKLTLAADGFADGEQFATVAYAARNTGVPFMVLKHRVLEEGKTLAEAIRESKPDVDAAAEVRRAREAARSEISSIVS